MSQWRPCHGCGQQAQLIHAAGPWLGRRLVYSVHAGKPDSNEWERCAASLTEPPPRIEHDGSGWYIVLYPRYGEGDGIVGPLHVGPYNAAQADRDESAIRLGEWPVSSSLPVPSTKGATRQIEHLSPGDVLAEERRMAAQIRQNEEFARIRAEEFARIRAEEVR